MATQAERRAATRGRIIESARRLFVERGFDDTTTTQILDDAGVSRGAMYHHFVSKEDVFAAVFDLVTAELISKPGVSVGEDETRLGALLVCCLRWLDDICSPEVALILLEQGPAVLGWKRCRDIEDSHSLQLMVTSIEAAVAAGEIETSSVELSARVLNAALSEIALALVHQSDGSITARHAHSVVSQLIGGLAFDYQRAGGLVSELARA